MNTKHRARKVVELTLSASLSGSGATTPHIDSNLNLSPIFKLHHDILLQIFQINANMDQDRLLQDSESIRQDASRAINATRISSQVNSLWRNLIIDAPTLWASLIDLESFDHSLDWWRKEVIRRTDDCPLYVKGSISLSSLDISEPWWLGFFNDNWTRVRKIDLDVRSGVKETNWFPHMITLDYARAAKFRKALPFLSQSAIALEYFRLSLPYLCDPLESSSTLFNDRAPQLTFFEIHSMRFSHQNTWLQQLRSLHIHEFHAQTFKSGGVLCQALSQMPNLESLSLEDTIADPSISVHQDPIHLPHLRYLCIREMRWDDIFGTDNSALTSTFWPLLDCIFPKPGCSVKLHLSPSYAGNIDVRVLSRLAKNYFQVNQPTKLDVLYGQQRCAIADNRGALDSSARVTMVPIFNFSAFVPPDSALISDGIMYQAFEAFFGLSFTKVTDLRLEIAASKGYSLSTCPQLADLLSTFASVKHLTTTSETLDFLCGSTTFNASELFPQLQVLKIPVGGFEPYFDGGPLLAATITRFLNSRKEAGFPVDTLHYQSSWLNQTLDDLTFLDDIAGLKVVWRTKTIGDGSYICGSGKPEELDFVSKMKSMLA